jgi:hypothetical protein
MRKSLKQWIRAFAIAALCCGSVNARSSAHDLPIFDSLSPMNCFGIGSCGFPFDGNSVDTPDVRHTSILENEDSIVDPRFGWSFADCFGAPNTSDPTVPKFADDHCMDDCEIRHFAADQVATPEQNQPSENASGANLSYPSSFIALIHSIGVRIPSFNLAETIEQLGKFAWTENKAIDQSTENSSESSEQTNYLANRRLMDDYLSGESFVGDWRFEQSYRGLNRFDHLHQDFDAQPLAVAEPKRPAFDASSEVAAVLSYVEEIQCLATQELHDLKWTSHYSKQFGEQLAAIEHKSLNKIQTQADHFLSHLQFLHDADSNQLATGIEAHGLDSYAICELEGREFLLPSKLAKQWNQVPSVPSTEIASASEDSITTTQLVRNLAGSASTGLDFVASKLQRFAQQLRAMADDGSQIANRPDADGIR